jgi:hypothetical protein
MNFADWNIGLSSNRSGPERNLILQQTNGRICTMNNVKKIVTILLALGVMTGFTQAATKHATPDATLRLKGGSFAAGIGFSWGSGTLTYKGKDYPVSVNGLSLGKVGITGGSATGEVYNLRRLQDFDGHYNAGGVGATLGGGHGTVAMTNQNNVHVLLESHSRGVDLTIAGGGVEMHLKK